MERVPIVNESKEMQPEKKEGVKENLLFEVKRLIRGMDVSVGIERGQEPVRGTVDFENKRIEMRVTPEGIRRGVEAMSSFLNRSGIREKLAQAAEKARKETERRRKEHDEQTVREYAKQEGLTEKEIIEDLLDELREEK